MFRLSLSLLLSVFLCEVICQTLVVTDTLSLPFVSGPYGIQTGCIQPETGKGYSALNTTSGMILTQFSLAPLEIKHPDDDLLVRSSLEVFNGAIISSDLDTLYIYGANNLNFFANQSIAAIESYDITGGSNISLITSLEEISDNTMGFLATENVPDSTAVYSILVNDNSTILFEMSLETAPSEIFHTKTVRSVFADYEYKYMVLVPVDDTYEITLATHGEESLFQNPSLLSLSAVYPWALSEYGGVTLNSTLYHITSCENQEKVFVLLNSCDTKIKRCNEFNVAVLNRELQHVSTIFVGAHSDVEKSTFSCSGDSLFVTISNTLYKINLDTGVKQTLMLHMYKDIVWAQKNPTEPFLYLGANPLKEGGSCNIVKVSVE